MRRGCRGGDKRHDERSRFGHRRVVQIEIVRGARDEELIGANRRKRVARAENSGAGRRGID